MFRTLPSREELARLDSFALGEAVAARLRALTGGELRALATATASRSEGYYKAELSRALHENPTNDALLRESLAAFFRENPRAIERCEPAFISAVLSSLPSGGENVAIDDDSERRPKPVLLAAGIALLLVGAGAAIDRAATLMHPGAAAATPAPIVVYVTPVPQPPARRAPPRPAERRKPLQTLRQPARPAAPPAMFVPAPARSRHAAAQPKPRRVARKPQRAHRPPKHVAQRAAVPTPTPMSAENLAVETTPKPRSWLQRQFDHLNPFKHRQSPQSNGSRK